MVDSKPQAEPPAAKAEATTSNGPSSSTSSPKPEAKPASSTYKAPERNPALRMLGLPRLPKKLPSRNWSIFLSITAAFSAAVIYDKREKKRATARWAAAVAPLAQQPIGQPSDLPRKLTVLLEAPPGEGLRVAQDHFLEYVKPILAASGLDWDFVQGRQQGDVRAAVAEKIRRRRKLEERPEEELLPTEENVRDAVRKKNGIEEYSGDAGDLVIGRNTWKEYVRGLHEGWLGPLDPPAQPEAEAELTAPVAESEKKDGDGESSTDEKKEGEEEKKAEEEKKPSRPPQPVPYNTTNDYSSSHIPSTIPAQLAPSTPVQFPHLLGFLNTPTRIARFLNRRAVADDIGREVAAVCFAAHREWRESEPTPADSPADRAPRPYEQQRALEWEEKNWLKSIFKDEESEEEKHKKDGSKEQLKERIWASPMVVDPRIAVRMRRFEIQPEDEERARAIVVPEEKIEGWIKGSLRSLFRWGASAFQSEKKGPNVGNVDDEDA